MNKFRIIALVSFCFVFASCSDIDKTDNLVSINLLPFLKQDIRVNLSDCIDSIFYIQPEFTIEAIPGSYKKVKLIEDKVFERYIVLGNANGPGTLVEVIDGENMESIYQMLLRPPPL